MSNFKVNFDVHEEHLSENQQNIVSSIQPLIKGKNCQDVKKALNSIIRFMDLNSTVNL